MVQYSTMNNIIITWEMHVATTPQARRASAPVHSLVPCPSGPCPRAPIATIPLTFATNPPLPPGSHPFHFPPLPFRMTHPYADQSRSSSFKSDPCPTCQVLLPVNVLCSLFVSYFSYVYIYTVRLHQGSLCSLLQQLRRLSHSHCRMSLTLRHPNGLHSVPTSF